MQRVLFAIGLGAGHSGDKPLQVELQEQSDSDLHFVRKDAGTNLNILIYNIIYQALHWIKN